ncbi:hypothetical protein BGX31_006058 [Mortierella sp. GBA43]|nr:hypothetical protein BGX31_006058 [Mortierella sp. GBA43]
MPSFHPPEVPNAQTITTPRVAPSVIERDHHSSRLLQADRHIGQAEHVQDLGRPFVERGSRHRSISVSFHIKQTLTLDKWNKPKRNAMAWDLNRL